LELAEGFRPSPFLLNLSSKTVKERMKTLYFQLDLDTAEISITETSGNRNSITNATMNDDPMLLRITLIKVGVKIPLDEICIVLSGEDEVHDSVKVEFGSHDEIPLLKSDICW